MKPWIDFGEEKKPTSFLGLSKKTKVQTQILTTEILSSDSYASETFQREHKKFTKREQIICPRHSFRRSIAIIYLLSTYYVLDIMVQVLCMYYLI